MKKKVLGVDIDDVSKKEILETVEKWLKEKGPPKVLVTPGPEFLLTAKNNEGFKKVLNSTDLAPNESFGLQLYCGFKNRVPGVDLMMSICKLAEKNHWTVGLMGNPNTKLSAKKLFTIFPQLKISFALDNPETDMLINDCDTLSNVDILFVGIGHPKQEKFLANCKLKIKNCKFRVGMGVGGSFDLIAGIYPRAPKIFQAIGMEWLWRGVTKPGHIIRAIKASILFPLTLLGALQ